MRSSGSEPPATTPTPVVAEVVSTGEAPKPRPLRFWWWLAASVAVPLAYIPLAEYVAVASWGTAVLLEGEVLLVLLGFVAFLAVLASPGMCVFARDWWQVLRLAVLSLAYLLSLLGGIWLGDGIRRDGFLALAARSAPLVAAIRAYEIQHGRPPKSLDELGPELAPTAPWTGMAAYPRYEYVEGKAAADRFHGNPWALYVNCSSGGINFDRFLYYPRQNYPRHGHGGWLELLGGWAYVHE